MSEVTDVREGKQFIILHDNYNLWQWFNFDAESAVSIIV